MPVAIPVDCPACGVRLHRKPGGRCPECGADVTHHVTTARTREERIERVVAVVSTVLVLGVLLLGGGIGLVGRRPRLRRRRRPRVVPREAALLLIARVGRSVTVGRDPACPRAATGDRST